MIKGGFTQKLLRIDLTTETSKVEILPEELLRKYYGGRTLGGKLLYDELPPNTDPLSAENPIFFMTGALVGTPAPGANRYCLVTKSPATGLFVDSYSGGQFGPEIKFAGYDHLAIIGKAKKPTVVFIDNDKVEFRDAAHLWGKTAWDAEETLSKELGLGVRIAVIGPAGEKLSNIAIVQNEFYHEAGRGGVGAVFGSKMLKAVAVRGTKGVSVANPDGLLRYIREEIVTRYPKPGDLGPIADRMKFGTAVTINVANQTGILPTYNYKYGEYDDYEKIDNNTLIDTLVESDKSCFGCSICCAKFSKVKEGKYKDAQIGGPEYETNALLGANIGVSDLNFILQANRVCDALGIDTMAAGVLVGFVMECYEKGILTPEDVGGLDLHFGNQEATLELLRMIALREGIGDILANGVKKAAEIIGHGTEAIAMHVKGLEFPGYRASINSPGFALAYCISDRGACHKRAFPVAAEQSLPPFSAEGRGVLMKKLYDQRIPWHDGVCCDICVLIASMAFTEAARIYTYVVGWDVDEEELQQLADRTACLLRSFNTREGMTRADETLPGRCFDVEESGRGRGLQFTKEMLNTMLSDYYEARGWQPNGIPGYELMCKLEMEDIAESMKDLGFYEVCE